MLRQLGPTQPNPPYRLTYVLSIVSSGIAITSVDGTTRANLSGTLSVTVTRQADKSVVFQDSLRNFSSYSANAETYPTRIASEDARNRLARALAKAATDNLLLAAETWAS